MNGVYPGLLAFAERTWLGGGQKGWLSTIGEPESKNASQFKVFEDRLLDHQKQYFKKLLFPYTQQSSLAWNLHGPYKNGGDLNAVFEPETNKAKLAPIAQQVVGGTIILRHWWAPLITGALANPTDISTWYASTKILSLIHI